MRGTLNFVLIGGRSAGKTSYLGALGRELIAGDEFTQKYLKPIIKSLDVATQPPKTSISTLHELAFQMQKGERKLKFSITDYGGEFVEFIDELDKAHTLNKQMFEESICESEGLFVFLPYQTIEDTQAINNLADSIDEIIRCAIANNTSAVKCIKHIPVVFVVSKWDKSPYYQEADEHEQAEKYIKSIDVYAHLLKKFKNNFSNVSIIPISSLGLPDREHLAAENTKPHRLLDPIEYAISHTFDLFEARCKKLEDEQDYLKILYFLDYRYKDIVDYNNKELLSVYEKAEKRVGDDLVMKIEQGKIHKLNEEQTKILSCIRSNTIKSAVDAAKNKSRRHVRRRWLLTFMVLGITVVLAFLYQQNSKQERLLMKAESFLSDNSVDIAMMSDMRNKILNFGKNKDTNNIVQRLTTRINALNDGLTDWQIITDRAKSILARKEKNLDIIEQSLDDLNEQKKNLSLNSSQQSALRVIGEGIIAWRDSVNDQFVFQDILKELENTDPMDIQSLLLGELPTIRQFIADPIKKETLNNLLSDVFSKFEAEKIDNLPDPIRTEHDYQQTKLALEGLNETVQIPGDIFEYTRSSDLMSKLKTKQTKLQEIDRAMENGIKAKVYFVSTTASNSPLGFNCGNHQQLTLEIDKEQYIQTVQCQSIGEESTISWEKFKLEPFVVLPGEYDISVVRRTGIPMHHLTQPIKRNLQFNMADMISLIIDGKFSKEINKESPYLIKFIRYE